MAEACEVWFYHLERSDLDQVLPELLAKTLQRGWRALVRSPISDRLEHLDGWLWTYREDSFLPHGLAEEPDSQAQPIVLTTTQDNPNAAQALFLIDGAEAGPLQAFERCVILFDGREPQALAAARRRWSEMKGAGHPASYWRQSASGWEKQG